MALTLSLNGRPSTSSGLRPSQTKAALVIGQALGLRPPLLPSAASPSGGGSTVYTNSHLRFVKKKMSQLAK